MSLMPDGVKRTIALVSGACVIISKGWLRAARIPRFLRVVTTVPPHRGGRLGFDMGVWWRRNWPCSRKNPP